METWPSNLPYPSVSSYQIKTNASFIRTKMSSGHTRQREMKTATPDTFNMSWDLTPENMAVFDYFFVKKIHNGSAWFKMMHYSAMGFVEGIFRFSDPATPYKTTNVGILNFKLSATLERKIKPLYDEEIYEFLVTQDLFEYLDTEYIL